LLDDPEAPLLVGVPDPVEGLAAGVDDQRPAGGGFSPDVMIFKMVSQKNGFMTQYKAKLWLLRKTPIFSPKIAKKSEIVWLVTSAPRHQKCANYLKTKYNTQNNCGC
jgi:hypothetical protein